MTRCPYNRSPPARAASSAPARVPGPVPHRLTDGWATVTMRALNGEHGGAGNVFTWTGQRDVTGTRWKRPRASMGADLLRVPQASAMTGSYGVFVRRPAMNERNSPTKALRL